DSTGNAWQLLVGPTDYAGSLYSMRSAIYYVHAPTTSATHTVTATLTNGAPLVMHVVAASRTDVTAPPTYSAIVDPGATPTTNVVTPGITVPAGTLLFGWAKNENTATATALDGYTLDAESTSYLWAEYATAAGAGTYTGHFSYDQAIGWQAAIVGLRP